MPSLADLEVTVSPLADPLSYPGVAVDADYLWLDTWMYGIVPAPAGELAQSVVTVDGGPLAAEGADPVGGLDAALALVGAAPISARHPVVSFGSNTAPAQLRDKFLALDPAGKVVPVVRGVIRGLSLGHSAHVSSPGYLPYVLVDNGFASVLPVFVLWLDPFQLAVMNRTEPNYSLVSVPAGRYPLTLRTGEMVSAYSAYKGKWGALWLAARTAPIVGGSQREVFGALNEESWFRSLGGPGDVRAQMSRFTSNADLREQVRVELAARGLVASDGWVCANGPDPRGSTATRGCEPPSTTSCGRPAE